MGSAVRANWHLGDLDLPQDDSSPFDVTEVGKPIDISATEAQLRAELLASIETEGRMYALFLHPQTMEEGYVSCDVKWDLGHRLMGGSRLSCFTCPHYTEDEMAPRANICALGRQQESTLTHMEALADHGSLDDELAEAFARDADAADELAEAVLA